LQSPPPIDERKEPKCRRALQLEIRKRIKQIEVFPHSEWDRVLNRMFNNAPGWTTFFVHFSNGALRILTAQDNDPASVIVHGRAGGAEWDPTKMMIPLKKRERMTALK
jgi:hypothetical protein